MDPRVAGLAMVILCVVAAVAAWLFASVLIGVILFIMIKGRYPIVARVNPFVTFGYSAIWGVLVALWFLLGTGIVSQFAFGRYPVIFDAAARDGVLVDAANFALEMTLAIFATSQMIMHKRSDMTMAILHPATLLTCFVGTTLLFDIYREHVTDLSEITWSMMQDWFSLEFVLVLVDVLWRSLFDPEVLRDYVISLFAASEGNLFRLTPLVSILLVVMAGWRSVRRLFGVVPPASKIWEVSSSGREDIERAFYKSLQFTGIALALGANWFAARSLAHAGLTDTVLGVYIIPSAIAGYLAGLALFILPFVVTITFALFTSSYLPRGPIQGA